MAHHILFQGGLGAGKTFAMVLLAWYIKLRTEAQGSYVQLFGNFEAEDSIVIDSYKSWYEIARAQGSIVMWDEAHVAFNSRGWSSSSATVATDTMMYTRKMQSLQLYATPSVKNIDSRLRDIVEILVSMRREPKGFRFYFQDFQTGEHLRTVFISMAKAEKIFALNLYDTHAFVRRFPLPSTQRQIDEFFQTLEEIHEESRTGLKPGSNKKNKENEQPSKYAWLMEKEGEMSNV